MHTLITETNPTRASIVVVHNHPRHLQCPPYTRSGHNNTMTAIVIAIDMTVTNTNRTVTIVNAIRHCAVAVMTVTVVTVTDVTADTSNSLSAIIAIPTCILCSRLVP